MSKTAADTQALSNNTASSETAMGCYALNKNTAEANNVGLAIRLFLAIQIGGANTTVGVSAAYYMTGSNNIAIGVNAGASVFSSSNNIEISNASAIESSTTRIGTNGSQTNTYIAGISGMVVMAEQMEKVNPRARRARRASQALQRALRGGQRDVTE